MVHQKIGEVICKSRQNQKMTQEEFASRLGVTPQAVSKWERGTSLPDVTLIAGICEILKIHSDVLLNINISRISENKDVSVEKEIKRSMIAEPLKIEFGYGLVSCVVDGIKTNYVNQSRKALALKTGMLLPVLRIQDVGDLKEKEIRIVSYDKVLLQKEYGEVDNTTYFNMIDEAIGACEKNYSHILNKQIVKCMMDNLNEQYPGALDGFVPDKVSYYEVMMHLKKVVEKEGSLRDLVHIMEEFEGNCLKAER